MSKLIKVRYKTWYWGNYCLANSREALPIDFEPYQEELHGWHNSEEYKSGYMKEPYSQGSPKRLREII